MRHSAACALIALSLLLFETNKFFSLLIFTVGVLWQGTLVILFPLFLLSKYKVSRKMTFILCTVFIGVGFAFSYINIYAFIPSWAGSMSYIYDFFPRIYFFFLQPAKSKFFELSKEIGHDPFWIIELPFYVLCVFLLSLKKFYNSFLILILSFTFFFVVAFRFHFSMILRFESLFELSGRAVLLWVLVSLLRKDKSDD